MQRYDFEMFFNPENDNDINVYLDNLKNKKVKSRLRFCYIFRDITRLRNEAHKKIINPFGSDYELKEDKILEKNYQAAKYRGYYYLLFHLIFLDFNNTDIEKMDLKMEKGLDAENVFDETDDIETQNWRFNIFSLSDIDAYFMAKKEYEIILNDKNYSINNLLNEKQIEKNCRIDPEDAERLFYLTNMRNNISYSTRLRRAKSGGNKPKYLAQKWKHEDKEYIAREIITEYYVEKLDNPKLKINDFLETKRISRRTFFNYKKIFDSKFKGKSKFEKAYAAYLIELEKDPEFRITTDFTSQFKLGKRKFEDFAKKYKRLTNK